MEKKQRKKIIILIVILILIDQILKIIFTLKNIVIGNEEGLSLGIIAQIKKENNFQYLFITIIAIIALAKYVTSNNTFIKMDSKIIISFSIAGAISNLIDRIFIGGIINYINIPKFESINLGYIYIAITWIGMAAILTKYTSKAISEKKNEIQLKKEVKDEKRDNSK